MTLFVLDENINSRRLTVKCNSQAKSRVHRYPKRLKKKKDYEMLPEVLSGDRTLVTADKVIVIEHESSIPDRNSGIVVVRLRRSSKTMTRKLFEAILDIFKTNYPQWHEIDWRGLFLEISEQEVCISPLPDKQDRKITLPYQSGSFERDLTETIARFGPSAGG